MIVSQEDPFQFETKSAEPSLAVGASPPLTSKIVQTPLILELAKIDRLASIKQGAKVSSSALSRL
jgi:hypothetical protein